MANTTVLPGTIERPGENPGISPKERPGTRGIFPSPVRSRLRSRFSGMDRQTPSPPGLRSAVWQLDHDACYRAVLERDQRYDGTFFTAVRTTGIYCRPICPAPPPKRENTVFFASAPAAQAAGFRPCLRCRPEIAPELALWQKSETIARAMAFIGSGDPSTSRIEGLAGRLGISTGQLRALFLRYFGTSLRGIVAARRALLAKRLVTDTHLTIADVARASGFSSSRCCNDTLRTLYRRPVRALRRADPDPTATSAVSLTLPYKPPYDWPAMIGFLAARAIRGVESVAPDSYARSIALGGAFGTIVVRPAGRRSALLATIRFPELGFLPAIVDRIRNLFDLGADPFVIDASLARDPYLARLVAARPGVRVPGAWDAFEIAVRAILGQQITVAAASLLAGKLAARYGDRLPSADGLALAGISHFFPRPDQLARAGDLGQAVGMPRNRAAAVVALAKACAADPALLAPGRGLDQSVARLTALPGIGQWTAQYIALRVLHEPDAFPAADVGVLRAMAGEGVRPTSMQALARAADWRPWRAYAVMHLWTAAGVLHGAGKAVAKG